MLCLLLMLMIVLGCVYGFRIFFIFVVEMNCSGIMCILKLCVLVVGVVFGVIVLVSVWLVGMMLYWLLLQIMCVLFQFSIIFSRFSVCVDDIGLGVVSVMVFCMFGVIMQFCLSMLFRMVLIMVCIDLFLKLKVVCLLLVCESVGCGVVVVLWLIMVLVLWCIIVCGVLVFRFLVVMFLCELLLVIIWCGLFSMVL